MLLDGKNGIVIAMTEMIIDTSITCRNRYFHLFFFFNVQQIGVPAEPTPQTFQDRVRLLLERVDYHTRSQLWLEPSCLGRHDIARIGNVDKLLHRDRIECKCNCHLTAIDSALQLAQATDTAHKVDSLRGAQVGNAEKLIQHQIRQQSHPAHQSGRHRYKCPPLQ